MLCTRGEREGACVDKWEKSSEHKLHVE